MMDPVIKAAKNILDAQLFGVMPSVVAAIEYETTPAGIKIKTPVPTVKLKRRVEPHDNIIGLCTMAGDQLTFLVKEGKAGVPDALPLDVNGRTVEVPVEAVECGEVTFASALPGRIRPVQGGHSIGNCRFQNAGTLGAWVQIANEHNGHTGWIGLSNNHVFAGYDGMGQIGDDILQPGVLDGGTEAIGLLAYIHPVNVDGTNVVDFAYCTPKYAQQTGGMFHANCQMPKLPKTHNITRDQVHTLRHGAQRCYPKANNRSQNTANSAGIRKGLAAATKCCLCGNAQRHGWAILHCGRSGGPGAVSGRAGIHRRCASTR